MPSCGHVGDFLAKKGRACEMLLRSLLHCCFLLDFGASRPSLEWIFGGPGRLWNRNLLVLNDSGWIWGVKLWRCGHVGAVLMDFM